MPKLLSSKYAFLVILYLSYFQTSYGQREILPLPLDKLNRDSLNDVIQQKEREKNYQALGEIYGGIYTYFGQTDLLDSTLTYALKAEDCQYKAGDSARYYFTELQLGGVHVSASDYDRAKPYLQKSLNYYYRVKNYRMLLHAYGTFSYLYWCMNDTVNMTKYSKLALRVNRIVNDTMSLVGLNYRQIQSWLGSDKLLEKSISLLHKNLKLINGASTFGNSENVRNLWRSLQLNLLGHCYYRLHKYRSAIKCLKEAGKYDAETVSSDQHLYRYRDLVKNYIELNSKDSALHYIEIFFEKARNVINTFDPTKMNDILAKYEAEKKQHEIDKLENQNKTQELIVASQRKWNITFIAMLVALLLSGFYVIKGILQKRKLALELAAKEAKYKEELHKQEEIQLRTKISRDLHDDVGSTLSSVKAYSEILHSNPDNPVVANLIKENAAEMIERLEVIAWATNPQLDSFGSFMHKVYRFANPVCLSKNINLNINTNGISKEMIMPGEVRQDLYLMIKEAINNMSKYSDAANCYIIVTIQSEKFIIEICDDGKGFDGTIKGTGHGLDNMRSRVKEIGGDFFISSSQGVGTQIKAEIFYPFKIPNSWDRKSKVA